MPAHCVLSSRIRPANDRETSRNDGNGWSIESAGQEPDSGIAAGSEIGPENTLKVETHSNPVATARVRPQATELVVQVDLVDQVPEVPAMSCRSLTRLRGQARGVDRSPPRACRRRPGCPRSMRGRPRCRGRGCPRIMAAAETSEILTSRTVRDLMTGSEIAFDERGYRELKVQAN
jgi:hypothetical protein